MEYISKVFINNGAEAEVAEYKEQVIKEYRDNPLIEALPNIMSSEEVIDKLALYPYFSEEERNLEAHHRYHIIQRLFEYFQPLNEHLDLESRISRIIRRGYIYRNPFSSGYAEQFKDVQRMIKNRDMELNSNQSFRTTASSFSLIGMSGMGKSTTMNRILSMYPQIVVHNEYRGIKFSMYQVVWIKLDTPHDGSTKGLCIDFMKKADSLIGSNYHKKYGNGRYAVNVLMPIMAQIAQNIGLGLLVIDEIQHLSQAQSGGVDKMLNFFVTMVNTMGIPIVTIGTMKAIGTLSTQFRQARRSSGQGDMVWQRMEQDESWNLLLEGLWDYQWTRKKAQLTNELNDLVYSLSQGITDIAIKLYAMAQIKAISSGKEEITANIVERVYNENLKLVKPMIEAIRSGRISEIAKYEDIYSADIDGFLNSEISKISLNRKIRELQNNKKKSEDSNKEHIKEQAILKLIELDIEPKKAKKLVEELLKVKGEGMELKEIVKDAYRLALNEEQNNEETKNLKSDKDVMSNKDLRFIVLQGKKKGITAYDALYNKGYIKHKGNDIFVEEVV